MNEVASPCCGSCEQYGSINEWCSACMTNVIAMDFYCRGKKYEPRNPIPLINVPGVKEMVQKAYRQGVKDRNFYRYDKTIKLLREYMKALEDKR